MGASASFISIFLPDHACAMARLVPFATVCIRVVTHLLSRSDRSSESSVRVRKPLLLAVSRFNDGVNGLSC